MAAGDSAVIIELLGNAGDPVRYTILDATAFSLGSGIGWFIAIVAIAAIREKIRYSNVPGPLRGLGITFIITGLMGIAFMSFSGIKYGKDEVKADTVQVDPATSTNP